MKPATKRALVAVAVALGATSITVCPGGPDDPMNFIACPDCGGEADWIECSGCAGAGLITCTCEGAGGSIVCRQDCFGKACLKHNDEIDAAKNGI